MSTKLWLVAGNPTQPTGRFREIAPGGRFHHRWLWQCVDTRAVRRTDKAQIAQWAEDYGEDSDFFRVRVLGLFPKTAASQFIGEDLTALAVARQYEPGTFSDHPKIMGVDSAWSGEDRNVILVRQGGDILDLKIIRQLPPVGRTQHMASEVARAIDLIEPDGVFIDVIGYGAGVFDRLEVLGYDVTPVNAGITYPRQHTCANKRMDMWLALKTWLETIGRLPNDLELLADLHGPELHYNAHGQWILEPKHLMKARGLASPDIGDALAFTFAEPVANRWQQKMERARQQQQVMQPPPGFDPLARW